MNLQLLLIAFILLIFAMFSLRSFLSHRTISARVQKQGASPFLGVLPMEFAYWVLSPLEKIEISLNLSPNFSHREWTEFHLVNTRTLYRQRVFMADQIIYSLSISNNGKNIVYIAHGVIYQLEVGIWVLEVGCWNKKVICPHFAKYPSRPA